MVKVLYIRHTRCVLGDTVKVLMVGTNLRVKGVNRSGGTEIKQRRMYRHVYVAGVAQSL